MTLIFLMIPSILCLLLINEVRDMQADHEACMAKTRWIARRTFLRRLALARTGVISSL